MAPVSRETVLKAVDEYGIAWTTQDPKRIGRLFTKDAIYIERCFDRNATFRGRTAIEKYWKYQICGKQSHIQFRHVDSEMIRDISHPMAVVKWLAEFQNWREHRGPNKGNKIVRFCQMAKLIFQEEEDEEEEDDDELTVSTTSDDNNNNNESAAGGGCSLSSSSEIIKKKKKKKKTTTKICYLEEYAQGMNGKSYQWPGMNVSSEELWDRIRFEPRKKTITTDDEYYTCQFCGWTFPSRTKLFEHLNYTDPVVEEQQQQVVTNNNENVTTTTTITKCVPNEEAKKKKLQQYVWICLSLSYYCNNNDDDDDPQEQLRMAIGMTFFGDNNNNDNKKKNDVTITWAVPPNLTPSAVVNVVTIKLPKPHLDDILLTGVDDDDDNNKNNNNNRMEELVPKLLNESLQTNTTTTNTTNMMMMMKIHTAGIVPLPCAPERREFEFYAAILPWNWLDPQQNKNKKKLRYIPRKNRNNHWKEKEEEEKEKSFDANKNNNNIVQQEQEEEESNVKDDTNDDGIDDAIIQRLRHGTRIMKDFGTILTTDVNTNKDDEKEEPSSSLQQQKQQQNQLLLRNHHTKEEMAMKLRVRGKSMKELNHYYCKLSISMRPTVPGQLERLIGLLISYVRWELIEDDDFLMALKETNKITRGLSSSSSNNKNKNDNNNKNNKNVIDNDDFNYNYNNFPSNLITLIEPAVTRYENKTKIKLCRYGKTNTPLTERIKTSIDMAHAHILWNLMVQNCKNEKEQEEQEQEEEP